MRAVTWLLVLALAGCAGGRLPGEVSGPADPAAPSQSAAPATPSPPAGSSSATAPTAWADSAEPPPRQPDSLQVTEARVQCWGKVERQKRLRDIDARIAFVDTCVADMLKAANQP